MKARIRVVSGIVQRQNKILLLKRAERLDSYPGLWGAVAGRVRDTETPEEALRREAREEIGCGIAVIKAGEAFEDAEGDRIWIVTPFLCRITSGSIRLNEENTAYRWVGREDMASLKCVPTLYKDFEMLGIRVHHL